MSTKMEITGVSVPPAKGFHPWKMPEWAEPVIIVTILLTAMFITRRRHFTILPPHHDAERAPLRRRLSQTSTSSSSAPSRHASPSDPHNRFPLAQKNPPKQRRVFGIAIETPNSSRFAEHIHSRILQKFPFLIEMFYWVVTFFFYKMTAALARYWYGGEESLWDAAQAHGIALLEAEAFVLGTGGVEGNKRWAEWRIQQWFLRGAEAGDWRGVWLTVLNRCYALIHIPGTVGFIAWYYYFSPTFSRFATVRRTMSLLNAFAFLIFTIYPCMPPRFLAGEYGFVDTVNAEDAQSVFMKGNFANALAAMPSMHFGYAFCISCVFLYESGVLAGMKRRRKIRIHGEGENVGDGDFGSEETLLVPAELNHARARRSVVTRVVLFALGVFYPAWILLAIIATANHYFLDAIVAAFVVLFAYLGNRVLLNCLPLEDWLLWMLRLEKPEPTTGEVW